jgi:predicted transcriptional regulator
MAESVKRSFTLPQALHERLERIATKEDRTVNAQVVRWLEKAVREYEAAEKSPGQRVPTQLATQLV